jgi:hypothetical protein
VITRALLIALCVAAPIASAGADDATVLQCRVGVTSEYLSPREKRECKTMFRPYPDWMAINKAVVCECNEIWLRVHPEERPH